MTAHRNGYVVLASQLRLREALGDVEEHEVIELEFTQDSNFYATAERAALSDTSLRLRLRRAPQYGAWMRNRRQMLRAGTGGRTYLTVTTAPGTIFRYPHSGHGATTSSSVKELELATVGIGVLSVWELWDFDRDEPLIPWVNPQLQFGLLGTLPTTSDKSIPAGSFVCGLGIRTGLATRPNGSGPESSFKLIMWYEALFDHERRYTFSNNLLFGFAVDLGTILN